MYYVVIKKAKLMICFFQPEDYDGDQGLLDHNLYQDTNYNNYEEYDYSY